MANRYGDRNYGRREDRGERRYTASFEDRNDYGDMSGYGREENYFGTGRQQYGGGYTGTGRTGRDNAEWTGEYGQGGRTNYGAYGGDYSGTEYGRGGFSRRGMSGRSGRGFGSERGSQGYYGDQGRSEYGDYETGYGQDYGRSRYSGGRESDQYTDYPGGGMIGGGIGGYSGGGYQGYTGGTTGYSSLSSNRGREYNEGYGSGYYDTNYEDYRSYNRPSRTYSTYYGRGEEEGRERGYRGEGQNRGEDRGWFGRMTDEVSSWFGAGEGGERERRSHRGRGPRNYSRSDDRIKEDINDRLTDNHFLDASDIEVEVNDGEVILKGNVESRYAKRLAEDVAEDVSGVKNVENRIRIQQEQRYQEFGGITTTGSTTGTTTGSTTVTAETDEEETGSTRGKAKGRSASA